jgi:hypothetical protein
MHDPVTIARVAELEAERDLLASLVVGQSETLTRFL